MGIFEDFVTPTPVPTPLILDPNLAEVIPRLDEMCFNEKDVILIDPASIFLLIYSKH